jgi:protease-4
MNNSTPLPPPPSGPLSVSPEPKKGIGAIWIILLLSAAFFSIFVIVTGVLYMKGSGGSSKGGSAGLFSSDEVGIIELNGVIMDSKKVLKQLEQFDDEADVKAVVLRLNSPGGAVAPSQEIYQAVKRYKKPLVVSMGSLAASGAFYVACGAKKVFANPGTITGSIGVIMEFINLQKLYEWAKVKRYVIKTGKFKDSGSEYREMRPDEEALLQGMVDDVLTQFRQAVSEGRKIPLEKVVEIADGRIFSGSQAKAAKLVDELGTLQDAIDDVAKQAGIKGHPSIVYPEKNRTKWLEMLLDGGGSGDSDGETSVPAAYSSAGGLVGLLRTVLGAAAPGVKSTMTDGIAGLAPGLYWIWGTSR